MKWSAKHQETIEQVLKTASNAHLKKLLRQKKEWPRFVQMRVYAELQARRSS